MKSREQPPVVERMRINLFPLQLLSQSGKGQAPRWKQDRKDNGRRDLIRDLWTTVSLKRRRKKPEVVENLLPLNGDEPLYESQRSQRTITC